MIQAIITDLDNTLLRSDSSISLHTVDALKACQAKGVKVIFATARSSQAASRYFEAFTPDIFIGYGGALVTAGDTVIRRSGISAELSYRLISECLAEPEVLSVMAVNETAALTNSLEYLQKNDSKHYGYSDFSENNGLSYLKISLVADNPDVARRIASHYPMCDMLRYSGENLYRFANRNAVKWSAVKAVAEHYKLNTDTFAAFGDDVNDLEMLAKCGIGVAVENAVAEVKAAAKYSCGSNDGDGVANWLEEYVLQVNNEGER